MIVRLAIRLVVLAAIIGVVTRIVPGIHLHGGFVWLLWIALIFSVVNLILGPVFRLLSLPLISSHLTVDNFGSAVLGGFLIAVFSWLAELLLPVYHRGKHAHPARAVHDSA